MTKSDLKNIVQFLALPEWVKYVAVHEDGTCRGFETMPHLVSIYGRRWSDGFGAHTLCRLKQQPNWRELCISVEGSDEE